MSDRVPDEKVDIPCPICGTGKVKLSGNVEWKEDSEKKSFKDSGRARPLPTTRSLCLELTPTRDPLEPWPRPHPFSPVGLAPGQCYPT